MDYKSKSSIFSNIKQKFVKNEKLRYILKLFIIFFISFIFINIILKLKKDLYKTVLNLKEFIKIQNLESEHFNEIINEEYRQKQNNFCKNINEFYNQEFESKIKLTKIIFNNITFFMFLYKKDDAVSDFISRYGIWEKDSTYNIIYGLNFYSQKKNLINKDIYIIDIGGNIGWYTFLLGKIGYNLITFEPSKINYYILNKNYCLNKEVNVTLINKGLFIEEKICHINTQKTNIGNGLINCNKELDIKSIINNKEIVLTKLSNYISFFKNKNLALIKMDIEGSEGKAFESGIELITKYHIPFIILEFSPNNLRLYDTNPKRFLEMFISNGYKINMLNFFEKKIYDIEYLLKHNNNNFYIVYSPFLEKYNYL